MRNLIRSIISAAMAVLAASAIGQGPQAMIALPAAGSMAGASAIKLTYGDSAKISNLLVDARYHANRALDQAEALNVMTRCGSAVAQGHSARLESMRQSVNQLGKLNEQLWSFKQEGSPWQQIAITRIDSQLRIMAGELADTIHYLNAYPERVNMPPYIDHVRATYKQATIHSELVSDFVKYGNARANASSNLQAIEQKLDLPPSM